MCGCVERLNRAIWVACVVFVTAATAEGAAVTLAWDPNTEPNVQGYRLSYGTTSGQYTTSIDVGNITSHTVTNLFAGQTYYFAVQAINAAGLSPYSNEISANLTSPLTVINLTANRASPQPAATTITFSATASGGTSPYQYKWWIITSTTQTVGRNWSTSSSFAWTPTVANPNYTIRVWARNASSTADAPDNPAATLEMSFAITSSGGTNTAPTVNAGPDRSITLPNNTTLTATVADDGLPTPGALTLSWTRVSGPGTVTFSAPSAATTNASFSTAGTYVLRLTASDGALSTADDVTVTVAGASVPVFQITMSAATYVNGQTVTATEFRARNPSAGQIAVRLRVWLSGPGVGEVNLVDTGADGSLLLPPGLNHNNGPLSLVQVTPSFPPKGNWQLNSRMEDPTTGVLLSQDINPFVIQ
jgi:hypothetical protein